MDTSQGQATSPVFLSMCWDADAEPTRKRNKFLRENGVRDEFTPRGLREGARPRGVTGGHFHLGSEGPGVWMEDQVVRGRDEGRSRRVRRGWEH